MEAIKAYRSLNKQIYDSPAAAKAADKKWISEMFLEELTDFVKDKNLQDKIRKIAENRSEVMKIFVKYSDMEDDVDTSG
jgi:hypothetical protein